MLAKDTNCRLRAEMKFCQDKDTLIYFESLVSLALPVELAEHLQHGFVVELPASRQVDGSQVRQVLGEIFYAVARHPVTVE